jgi:hypothetical protein
MAKKSIKYPVLKIAECIGISHSIWFDGQDMVPFLWNLPSWSTNYERLRNFIDDIPRSLDRWRMLSKDRKPKGGILSQHWEIRRYLGIMIERWKGCRRNCVTERRRRELRWRRQRDGGGIS